MANGHSWPKDTHGGRGSPQDSKRVFFLLRPAADSETSELRALNLATGAVRTVMPGVF